MTTTGSNGVRDPVLYREIAARLEYMIAQGIYRPGERLPSIRELGRQLRVGLNTAKQAYIALENARVIEARPRSGYYVNRVRKASTSSDDLRKARSELVPMRVTLGQSHRQMVLTMADERLLPLGRGSPSPDLLPGAKLNRMLAAQGRRSPSASVSYAATRGIQALRLQIAKRSLEYGCSLSADDIVVTSGCVEAVTLALQAVCRPGDTVAVESPLYYAFLNALQFLQLQILEIPTTENDGLCIDVLGYALRHNDVRACLVISSFNNPLGSLMPDDKKLAMVRLLAKRDIPLIEDDVYGDLGHGSARPPVFKAYDEKGLVLLCSSFSKTLAPGYRVGWIAAGRFQQRVEELKSLFNIATATPTQLAIADFLSDGGYDRHLRATRRQLAHRMARMREAVTRSFPLGTVTSQPAGGFCLWVRMPDEYDSLQLYAHALRHGISVAPGSLFTRGDDFKNCVRLNGSYWSDDTQKAIEILGSLAANASLDARARRGRCSALGRAPDHTQAFDEESLRPTLSHSTMSK